MAVASDKLSSYRKPLLLLKLESSNALDTNTPSKANHTNDQNLVELDLDELKSLLKSLRAAQKVGYYHNFTIFMPFL